MRGVVAVLACVAACGRIGFGELRDAADGDGASGDGSGSAAARWTHVTAYQDTTCAERSGNVYCWGDNSLGQLGVAAGGSSKVPVLIGLRPGVVESVSIGTSSGCAIVDGSLYCWGDLGTPQAVPVTLAMPATMVSVGHDFQCVIAGDALCWGTNNSTGAEGTGDTSLHTSPTPVMHQGAAFVAVDTGDDHSCGLDANSVAWCWGHNDNGAIGAPLATAASSTPVIQDATIHTLPQIAGWHSCAFAGSTVKCWGDNTNGELGNGGNGDSATPVLVGGLTAPSLIANGGGPSDHDASCVIDGGRVHCWGNGFFGRLGQGTANSSATPVAVVGLPAINATEIAIGDDHACAALADGSLWCWGRGDLGQLGDGKGASSLVPVQVQLP